MKNTVKVLISLPIYKRAWILPYWFEAIEKQDVDLVDIGFSFLTAKYEDDKETHDMLFDWFQDHPQVACFHINEEPNTDHKHHVNGRRQWVPEDYAKMSNMRNELLDLASSIEPEYFFSLDSDILLKDPSTISRLVNLTEPYSAVSPLMFMRHFGVSYPSVMSWVDTPGGKAFRKQNYPLGTVFESDIIMAAVMMSPDVYKGARYSPHRQGEDVGWAANCAKHGYRLIAASNIYCPHIMHESSSTMPGVKGPGILDFYLRSGDDRGFSYVNS